MPLIQEYCLLTNRTAQFGKEINPRPLQGLQVSKIVGNTLSIVAGIAAFSTK